MKYIIVLALGIFFFKQKTAAQYCGLTYYYDADGNRIERAEATCEGGGDGRALVINDTTTKADSAMQQLTEALYPNPTSGPVQVVFNNPVTETQVLIVDYLGRQLYSATVSGTNIPLDLSHYNDGVYMIVVRTGGNSYETTVVKE